MSIKNIIFFYLVVDAAQKFSDLNEMNKYVLIMFAVFVIGSIAGSRMFAAGATELLFILIFFSLAVRRYSFMVV